MSKEELYIFKRKIKAGLCRIPYYICGLLHIQEKKIVFSAFEGGGYCCNPKYIAEELLQRIHGSGASYKLYWLVNDISKEFPEGIHLVKNTLWNRAYHLSTAKVWIDNARKNYGTRKRKGQFYILTWHGAIGFKSVGRLRGNNFSKIAELVSKSDAKNVDVLLSNSQWCSNIWKTAFWNEPVKITGSPRCDILINCRKEQYQKVRKEYGLPTQAKIVIYAPTFRGGSQETTREVFSELFTLDYDKMRAALHSRFGGEWYVMVRLHPQLTLRMQKIQMERQSCMIDISERDDLYEVLAGADVFVSDYSSAAFDASLMRIPVFLYADDIKDYVADRGALTWKIADIPFPLAQNNQELQNLIYSFDEERYLGILESCLKKMGVLEDGKASRRVADMIEGILKHTCQKE